MFRQTLTGVPWGVSILLAQAATALAADNAESGGEAGQSTTPWAAILYLLVATAAICVVGFKNSKRTHLD
jgi:hypothetical protein